MEISTYYKFGYIAYVGSTSGTILGPNKWGKYGQAVPMSFNPNDQNNLLENRQTQYTSNLSAKK